MSEPTSAPVSGRAVTCPAREDAAQRNTRGVAASLELLADHLAGAASAVRELARDLPDALADLRDLSDLSLMQTATPGPEAAQQEREFMCQQELADLLGCTPRSVRRMELEGELPRATYFGGLKRWRRADISAWLEEHRPVKRSARR